MQENYIVGIYARLSRDDERAGESVSIENQKEMLSRYVREQGWTLYDYYCDDGVSGTTFDRCILSSNNPWFCQSKFLGIATEIPW